MCGIAGFCNFNEDYTYSRARWAGVLVDMRKAIAHRGHDQTGEYLDRHVGLSHTRLSIRDISGGIQPMRKFVGGYEYVIVYNGEIYNTDELLPELERRGYVFETTCDTEVILCAYIEYGTDCAEMLNGIYSFAVWDGKLERLMLCRDRVGVKPLFYAEREGGLVFGSEPKALFAHPDVLPEADDDSFREIFAIGPARTPGVGVFRGVREVVPGHFVIFDRSGLLTRTYWTLRARPHEDSYEATVQKIGALVRDAIRRQMVSDVPVCSFLSGGLDSSIITAVASRCMRESSALLHTFSFDFTENDTFFEANSFQPTRDRPFVDMLLPLLGVDHTYLYCTDGELADMLPLAVRAKDLPGMTDVDASLLYFCGLVSEHNKVALTGECADEIFGGYPWFYRPELLYADGFPWSHDMDARCALLRDDVRDRLKLDEYTRSRYSDALSRVPRLPGEGAEDARRREVSCLNQRWFMQTLLDRMDRTSMAHGLEVRVPFADHRIVEYMYNVPWSMKFREGSEKALLRDACEGLLPPPVLRRKKSPYPKTYSPGYEKILAGRLRCLLDDKDAPINEFIDREKTERFLSSPKDYGKPWFGQLMAGPQSIAYILQVNDWMELYGIS